jgi:hypothetical protein
MFKPKDYSQNEYELVSIDELVPDDHLLRLIDKYIDFSFLLEKLRPYYSDDNGRPTDLLILFKMMFIGYNYGIRSESSRAISSISYYSKEEYREYKSDSKKCQNCPLLSQCTRSKNKVKVVTRHVWEEFKEKVRSNRLSKSGKVLYKFRKEKIERSFADSKELHGLRYCRLRGLKNASEQALLTAACQNIKKIATHLAKLDKKCVAIQMVDLPPC